MLVNKGNNLTCTPDHPSGEEVGKLIGHILPVNMDNIDGVIVRLLDAKSNEQVEYTFHRITQLGGGFALSSVNFGVEVQENILVQTKEGK